MKNASLELEEKILQVPRNQSNFTFPVRLVGRPSRPELRHLYRGTVIARREALDEIHWYVDFGGGIQFWVRPIDVEVIGK